MNILIEKLNHELEKVNLGFATTKENLTTIKGYLYSLDDCKNISPRIKDYTGCKKLDVMYKKEDLHTMIEKKTLNSFALKEGNNYDMAKKLNLLR